MPLVLKSIGNNINCEINFFAYNKLSEKQLHKYLKLIFPSLVIFNTFVTLQTYLK